MPRKTKKVAGPGWWSQKKKIETVTTYLALGNAPMTEGVTGVPRGTIRQWKMQQWWKDLVEDIRNEEDTELDVKLSKIIDKSLDVVMDRVTDGDFIFDSKTGKLHRKPVGMKDALQAVTQVFDKRNLLRGKPTSRVEKHTTQDTLNSLAEQFAKFAAGRTIEGEVIAEDIGEAGESTPGEGDREVPRLCDSDEFIAEGGGFEEGDSGSDTEGGDEGEYVSSGEGEGPSSESLGEPQNVRVLV